jgi:hypothetical protein
MPRFNYQPVALSVLWWHLATWDMLFTHGAVIWMVPRSEYTKVWSEWRNENCRRGSIWRPALDPIDPGDGKARDVIFMGDIFLDGPGPPTFPTTVLVFDEDKESCATQPGQVSYPCMEATEATGGGAKVPILFAKTEWPSNGTLWTARLGQCVCDLMESLPDDKYRCARNSVLPSGSSQPVLSLDEDGYARYQDQLQLRSPLCPANYYVFGHVGSMVGEAVPDNYKCVHKTLMRRAGETDGKNLYKSHVPLGPSAKVWSDVAAANPTTIPEYLSSINVYSPNCGFVACPPTISSRMCDNDTLSLGLFYADQYPPMRITASRNPDDVDNLSPWVGPRCLTHYRSCDEHDDNCDFELGISPEVTEENPETGQTQYAQRRGLVYAQPWVHAHNMCRLGVSV